jgi:diacylglycerol O-acyltransferase / wax synthase
MGHYSFDPVSGADAVWLRLESPENPLVITALIILEPISLARLKIVFTERFLIFQRFTRRPVKHFGFYLWEIDPDFRLDHHIHRVLLPAPADKSSLQSFVSKLMSQPLDQNKPCTDLLSLCFNLHIV